MEKEQFKKIQSSIPQEPGIYQYFDEKGKLLYVGKAKNIRNRVSSYFNANQHSLKTIELVQKIQDIQFTIVNSEHDAFILENELIKNYQPKYNINLKDDKTYPYIVIKKEAFPRIHFTRRYTKDGSEYIGPFTDVVTARALVDLLKENLPIRSCNLNLSTASLAKKKYKVCLEYHMGNCLAPCTSQINQSDYDNNIKEIREIIKTYGDVGKIYLGGIPMITDDMMSFIKSDIIVFGLGVLLFIIATLWFIFRKLIWIIVPISSCFFSVLIMTGLLGLLGWKVTVISSNFIALMLILTMAMNIHMSTRFLQLREDFPNLDNLKIIIMTTSKMFWPIIYTVLTTICAFLSLVFSGIKPIIDFGWMMTLGLITSFIITFTLLPTLLSFMSSNKVKIKEDADSKITSFFGKISINNKSIIFLVTGLIVALSVVGISKLEVENSFINYFNKNTEIYKGMKLIDEKLGGTTPLEVILKFPENIIVETTEDDEFESWDDEGSKDDEKYWFTKDKIEKIQNVHNYLDNLPAVGKVLSFSSIIEVATQLNNNKPLGTLEMGVLYSKIPESIKKDIIDPYISVKDNEARISLRIIDSQDGLRRNDLINQINYDLENELKLSKEEFKLAGVLILFNNLLQSLFKSQILTLGLVMIGIFAMFMILFRNFKLSLIGVVPNFIAAFFILGIIGLLGIPLDMMTITIAAITIGIAVDNSIHYIYRFKEEFLKIKDYNKTLKVCHSTVGVAILNTSITIVFGFSILVFSKFIPTIYFGVFTGLAMLLAMISVLTLLPSLILISKPFGK